MNEFMSPQTGSIYQVFAEMGSAKVCYRNLGDGSFRVRIQARLSQLENARKILHDITSTTLTKSSFAIEPWSQIKDNDHISTVVVVEKDGNVDTDPLIKALLQACRSVLYSVPIDVFEY